MINGSYAVQDSNKINFAHIAPTPHLDLTQRNGSHLLLAHLVETDPDYVEFYANLNDGKHKTLDNSAFELFKQGREMFDPSKLVEMGKRVNADTIVMSDYPRQPSIKTIQAAVDLNQRFMDEGFKSFFVPQSTIGSMSDYLRSVEWALNQPNIDLIGLSILGCPIALGLDEKADGARSDSYKMQRFLSRWKILNMLDREGLLADAACMNRFHCLGMVDGPNEINLLKDYHHVIRSWDSSIAIQRGLHGLGFDDSPTGCMEGKFEKEVDFNMHCVDDDRVLLAEENIEYINNLCRGSNATNNRVDRS